MGSTQDETAVAVLSPHLHPHLHPPEAGEVFRHRLGPLFAGLRVATGTRYIMQWMNALEYGVANPSGRSGWAQVVDASPPCPHNFTGKRIRVHLCNVHPCSASDNSAFHVLEEEVCDWCGSDGYSLAAFAPPMRHRVPHMDVLVLRHLGGFLRCEGCVDLDEPPHWPNNRRRFAARLLHNKVLPVAARVEPICTLIAQFWVENSA